MKSAPLLFSIVLLGSGLPLVSLGTMIPASPTSSYRLHRDFAGDTGGDLVVGLPPPPPGVWFPITEQTNFDGTRWVILASAPLRDQVPPLQSIADALADAGAYAYAQQVHHSLASCAHGVNPNPHNWGFESADPDCTLKIYVTDALGVALTAAVWGGNDVEIIVSPFFLENLHALGLYLNPEVHTREAVARSVIGHEHFHNLQYVAAQWNAPISFTEGQARFTQTLIAPAVEADASSMWYSTILSQATSNGVNYYQHHPDLPMCPLTDNYGLTQSRAYDYALYWGYLYWKNGGIDVLRRELEAQRGLPAWYQGGCNENYASAITAALAASEGLHDSHAQAVDDFARHVFLRDFQWAAPGDSVVYDWGLHLVHVAKELPYAGLVQGPLASAQILTAELIGQLLSHPECLLTTTPECLPELSFPVPPATHVMGAWGLQYLPLPTLGSYAFSVDVSEGDWATRLFLTNPDGSFTVQPVIPGETLLVEGAAYKEILFQAARVDARHGAYTAYVEGVPL